MGGFRRVSSLLVAVALVPSGCGPAASDRTANPAGNAYRILVTNDDGIESPGIQRLADALQRVGEVTVVAPCGQRSGASMSVRLDLPIRLRPYEPEGEPRGHCVDATPAGSVILATQALAPEGGFDLVVSGINAGANTGDLARMSGTVGAAMAGAYYGIPAVAASLGGRSMDFGYAAEFVARFVEELRERPSRPGTVFSINLPAASADRIAGVAVRGMGGSYLRLGYQEVEGEEGARVFQPRITPEDTFPAGSDTEAFMEGMITITPLRFDATDREALDDLSSWGLDEMLTDRPSPS